MTIVSLSTAADSGKHAASHLADLLFNATRGTTMEREVSREFEDLARSIIGLIGDADAPPPISYGDPLRWITSKV